MRRETDLSADSPLSCLEREGEGGVWLISISLLVLLHHCEALWACHPWNDSSSFAPEMLLLLE